MMQTAMPGFHSHPPSRVMLIRPHTQHAAHITSSRWPTVRTAAWQTSTGSDRPGSDLLTVHGEASWEDAEEQGEGGSGLPASQGSSIRMYNQTFIDVSRRQFWNMLQGLVPADQWNGTAVVLASLECIYSAEYSKAAEEAIAALNAADSEEPPDNDDALAALLQKPITGIVRRAVRKAAQDLVWSFSSKDRTGGSGAAAATSTAASSTDSFDGGEVDGVCGGERAAVAQLAAEEGGLAARALVDAGETSSESSRQGTGPGGSGEWGADGKAPQSTALEFTARSSIAQDQGSSGSSGPQVTGTVSANNGTSSSVQGSASGSTSSSNVGPSSSNESSSSSSNGSSSGSVPNGSGSSDNDRRSSSGGASSISSGSSNSGGGGSSVSSGSKADRRFLSLLLPLLKSSHLTPLTRRDAEIAKSLNSDYLSQLFILSSGRKLDGDLAQAFWDEAWRPDSGQRAQLAMQQQLTDNNPLQAEPSSTAAGAVSGHAEPSTPPHGSAASSHPSSHTGSSVLSPLAQWLSERPPECSGVLIFKRGHALEVQRGRLLLPKLDFVQTLIAGTAARVIGSALAAAWSWLATVGQRIGEQITEGGAQHGDGLGAGGGGTEPTQAEGPALGGDERFVRELMEQGGMSARATLTHLQAAGTSLTSQLSDWGLVPRLDVLPLPAVEQTFPVVERPGLAPKFVHKVSLTNVLGTNVLRQGLGHFARVLVQEVTLLEPAFREVVVVYRKCPPLGQRSRNPFAGRLWGDAAAAQAAVASGSRGVGGGSGRGADRRKLPVQIRIYRDIPLPNWRILLPEKILQFRPLDLVRTDLFALTGLGALLANARYESIILDVVTLVSAAAFVIRVVLGYQRMAERYRSYVNEVLRQRTVASQEGAIDYLASCAALQQFKQAALAYVLLLNRQQRQLEGSSGSGGGSGGAGVGAHASVDELRWDVADLGVEAERTLRSRLQLQVHFDVEQAVGELLRLGLVVRAGTGRRLLGTRRPGAPATPSALAAAVRGGRLPAALASSCLEGSQAEAGAAVEGVGTRGLKPAAEEPGSLEVVPVPVAESTKVLQCHWDALLWVRVDAVLGEFGSKSTR